MFDREIDVAEIMREIKKKASAYSGVEGISALPVLNNEASAQLADIYNEISRINDFTENTRVLSAQYVEMGRTIPVSYTHPGFLCKLLIFYKRFVRKSTRFLALDQKNYNERTNECIKALAESQQEVLKLITVVNTLSQKNEQLEQQLQQMQSETEGFQTEVKGFQTEVKGFQTEVKGFQAEVKGFQAEVKGFKAEMREQQLFSETGMDSETYLKFENKYRGTEDEVKRRLWFYVDHYIRKTVRSMEKDVIVDLGCGRGEWLEILKVEGYQCAGVDLNKSMVDLCLEKGLDVQFGDAVNYLKSLPDGSVKVVSGFQIAEHMPLAELTELIKEAFRVLSYHGILLLETPNCKNVEVGAAAFYQDPTHKRPVHQDYLQFLAQENGFYETEIALWKNAETQQWLDSVIAQDTTGSMESPVLRTVLETLKSNVYVSPDYALIATK